METAVGGTRSDARRNHERLLRAARDVFATSGPGAPLDEIAREAGVGIGTLYRHFPSRTELVAALYEQEAGRWHAVARRALEAEHAEDGLRLYFAGVIALQAELGLVQQVLVDHSKSVTAPSEMTRLSEELLERAREEGAIRDDFTLADLAMLFWSLAHLAALTDGIASNAWRRQLDFVLDGLRPEAASRATVRPLSSEQMKEASERVASR